MTFLYTGKNVTIRDSFKDYAERKIGKLDKLLQGESVAHIRLENEKNVNKVEVSIKNDNLNIRAEVEDYDANIAIDKAEIVLDGQIRKYKTKLEKRRKRNQSATKHYVTSQCAGNFEDSFEEEEEEEGIDIVKVKKFAIKPMFPEDACLEMELMNHDFYVFFNAETDQVNVVYKRHNGGYGLIEPTLG